MTLGQFIKVTGHTVQGKVTLSVWDLEAGDEIERITVETDCGLMYEKEHFKGFLSKKVTYIFANLCGELVIEIEV